MALEPRSLTVLRFGTFEVDLRAGGLRKRGVRIKLQEQPFQVLAVLLQRPGEVVTREELRNQNWPADTFVDFDNSGGRRARHGRAHSCVACAATLRVARAKRNSTPRVSPPSCA